MAVPSKRPRLNGFVNRIHLVGIELEGGWDEAPKGEEILRDGSVRFKEPQVGNPGPISVADLSNLQVSQEVAREVSLRGAVQVFRRASSGQPGIATPPPSTPSVPALKGEIISPPIPAEKIAGWVRHAYPK